MANSVSDIVEKITQYIQIKTEQLKLRVISHISRIMAHILVFMFLLVIGVFLVFFLSMSLATYLNEVLASQFLGYLIVAGCYLLLMIIIFLLMRSGKVQGWFEQLLLNIAESEDEQED